MLQVWLLLQAEEVDIKQMNMDAGIIGMEFDQEEFARTKTDNR